MSADNPPAFPRTGEGFGNPNYDEPGMFLRDWFAAHALTGVLADNRISGTPGHFADAAYELADAMLARRGR